MAEQKLSGEMAYELFMDVNNRMPLHDWIARYGNLELVVAPGYVIAVVRAYTRMLDNCGDGRYGVVRDYQGNVASKA